MGGRINTVQALLLCGGSNGSILPNRDARCYYLNSLPTVTSVAPHLLSTRPTPTMRGGRINLARMCDESDGGAAQNRCLPKDLISL